MEKKKKTVAKTRTPQTSFTFLIESLIRDKKNNGGFRQLECLEGLMREHRIYTQTTPIFGGEETAEMGGINKQIK